MDFKPITKMWERVDIARQESDTALFFALMYMGEMTTKIVTGGLVAAIKDDLLGYRYRQLHRLIRADGVGEWGQVIDEVLAGPASSHLLPGASDDCVELNTKIGVGTWQYDALDLLNTCLKEVEPEWRDLPTKIFGRQWFSDFSHFRNKTRGHGAILSSVCSELAPFLEDSIRIVLSNHSIFKRPWAYVHRSISGKYHHIPLTSNSTSDLFKSELGHPTDLPGGIYIHFGHPTLVDLIASTSDTLDFFFPNGGFNDRRNDFELISYITSTKRKGDATPYLMTPNKLPASETEGGATLELRGNCFTNLPPLHSSYVHRRTLESELRDVLSMEHRHPIITIAGRGGIGKTSLALSVLNELSKTGEFEIIVWFSARDIDLLPEGPKPVAPRVLSEKDVAREFADLMGVRKGKAFDSKQYLSDALTQSPMNKPILFVFDNFETVIRPMDLFRYIDHSIRLPNKVLITTREQNFKGDYEVEVLGMTPKESVELIDSVSLDLNIRYLITPQYRQQLIRESDGHPYVIRILLGEVAKKHDLAAISRIIARKEDILSALFERIYTGLSPIAQRVFLTLSGWRSTVPLFAVEAVLYRRAAQLSDSQGYDKIDVEKAVEELRRSSFIEVTESEADKELFITLPLVASVFGKSKLEVHRLKSEIEADTQLLQHFGAIQPSEVRYGVAPRIHRILDLVEERITLGRGKLDDYLVMLEFIAGRHPNVWLHLIDLHEKSNTEHWLDNAIMGVERYLQSAEEDAERQRGWTKMVQLRQQQNDLPGEIEAWVALSRISDIPFEILAIAVTRVNLLLSNRPFVLPEDVKHRVVQQIVEIAGRRIEEADANEGSRLAELCLHINDEQRARQFTVLALERDPHNYYAKKLATTLRI